MWRRRCDWVDKVTGFSACLGAAQFSPLYKHFFAHNGIISIPFLDLLKKCSIDMIQSNISCLCRLQNWLLPSQTAEYGSFLWEMTLVCSSHFLMFYPYCSIVKLSCDAQVLYAAVLLKLIIMLHACVCCHLFIHNVKDEANISQYQRVYRFRPTFTAQLTWHENKIHSLRNKKFFLPIP